ncbi:MAG TPA: PA2169 family four-helix-bundle protein [Anseongella sp.]|nr:PA2169 family four-helix-bundle protein [Anseongella sp.]
MDQTKDRIDHLNKLVTINNDRIEGYQKAADETNDPDLKALFEANAQQSARFKMEIAEEIALLGGKINEGTSATGKLYHAWMDIRHALSTNDRKAVLKSCEFGEDIALETYNEALNTDIPYSPGCRLKLENQRLELQRAHDSIKKLRDIV